VHHYVATSEGAGEQKENSINKKSGKLFGWDTVGGKNMGMLQGCASAKQRDAAWWAYRAVAVFVRLHCAVIAGEAECKRDIKEGREEGERKGEGRRQLTVGSIGENLSSQGGTQRAPVRPLTVGSGGEKQRGA